MGGCPGSLLHGQKETIQGQSTQPHRVITHPAVDRLRSPIVMVGALVLSLVIGGMVEASATGRPATPRTRRSRWTTAFGSSAAARDPGCEIGWGLSLYVTSVPSSADWWLARGDTKKPRDERPICAHWAVSHRARSRLAMRAPVALVAASRPNGGCGPATRADTAAAALSPSGIATATQLTPAITPPASTIGVAAPNAVKAREEAHSGGTRIPGSTRNPSGLRPSTASR